MKHKINLFQLRQAMQIINGITLDRFTVAYITCALWSSTGEDEQPLDKTFAPYHIAPESLQSMAEDCKQFRDLEWKGIRVLEMINKSGLHDERAGHNFWLNRNRHGSGFWDEGCPFGSELSEASHTFGSSDLYLGDDGKLYVS